MSFRPPYPFPGDFSNSFCKNSSIPPMRNNVYTHSPESRLPFGFQKNIMNNGNMTTRFAATPDVVPNVLSQPVSNNCNYYKSNSDQTNTNHRFNSHCVPRPRFEHPYSQSSIDNNCQSFNSLSFPPPMQFLNPERFTHPTGHQQSQTPATGYRPDLQSFQPQINFFSEHHQDVSTKNFPILRQNTNFQSNLQINSSYKENNNTIYQSNHNPFNNVSNLVPQVSESAQNISGDCNSLNSVHTNLNNSLSVPAVVASTPVIMPGSKNMIMHPLIPMSMHIPPPALPNNFPIYKSISYPKSETSVCVPLDSTQTFTCAKELSLVKFLEKFPHDKKVEEKIKIPIPKFRSTLADAFALSKELLARKQNLHNLLQSDKETWDSEMMQISSLKDKLSEMCSFVSDPNHLNYIKKKLHMIKKKRDQKRKTKLNKKAAKIKDDQLRKERNQEIDKWLDDIKEKNLKLKREAEMKKEADNILLEVRKKIHEANRTIEKIKVFEKLRNARKENAVKKGLYVTPEHDENFERKVTILKNMMSRQLSDYEAEEKALRVMLETEQEGQLEEETQWKLKKVKAFQLKKQKNIIGCLFGNSEDPHPTEPLYLFHKYHTSAYFSIENLINVRQQWDIYLSEDGEAIPQQWIVPTSANNSAWEQCLNNTSGALKN